MRTAKHETCSVQTFPESSHNTGEAVGSTNAGHWTLLEQTSLLDKKGAGWLDKAECCVTSVQGVCKDSA